MMKESASARKGPKFAQKEKEGRKGDSISPNKPPRRQTRQRGPGHNVDDGGEASDSEDSDDNEDDDEANGSDDEGEGDDDDDDDVSRDSDDLEIVEPPEVISNIPLTISNEKFEKLLYELMDQRGTPILKTPVLGNCPLASLIFVRRY